MSQIEKEIDKYLRVCQFEKQLSEDTLKAYRIDLGQFATFVGDGTVDKTLLGDFVARLNVGFAPRSVKRKLASVRAFYQYMEENEIISESPFHRLHFHIQSPRQLPRIIPEETVKGLLETAYHRYELTHDRWVLRDILVLELLFSTGMRVSELCRLTSETFHLEPEGLQLMIFGKGRKERALRVTTPELLILARRYFEAFGTDIAEQNAIMLNRRRRPLQPQSVRQIINGYMKQLPTSCHVTPHMFRHTFASSLLENGVDIRYIQSPLEHNFIATAEIYTPLCASTCFRKYRAFTSENIANLLPKKLKQKFLGVLGIAKKQMRR